MYNILKKQNKILTMLSLTLILSLCFFDNANAEKTTKRSGNAKSRKGVKGQAKNSLMQRSRNVIPTEENKTAEDKKEDKTEKKDISNITKYNCETLYNKCMNEQCYLPTNGRCSCDNNEKFTKADEKCGYIHNACPNLENDIVATFKRNAKFDCSNFAVADIKNTQVSLSNIIADLKVCMQPKCKSKGNEFVGCFDEDNFEKKFKTCEKVYSKAKDVDTLKSMFKKDMALYKKKYCDEIYGTIKADGECYLQIGFGPSRKVIQKVKEFKVGDTIICSESSFGVALKESKAQKIRATKEIVLAGFGLVENVTGFAGQLMGSMQEDKTTGKLKYAGDGVDLANDIIAGTSAVTNNSHLVGAIGSVIALKEGDFKYNGYCYVLNGNAAKELFGATDDFYYKLRWDESWNTGMFSTGEVEE